MNDNDLNSKLKILHKARREKIKHALTFGQNLCGVDELVKNCVVVF